MATNNSFKMLFAGVLGLAAGVAIGILLAPESGSKTRKKLKKRFRAVSDNFRDQFSEEIDKIKTALHLDEEEAEPPEKDKPTRRRS